MRWVYLAIIVLFAAATIIFAARRYAGRTKAETKHGGLILN